MYKTDRRGVGDRPAANFPIFTIESFSFLGWGGGWRLVLNHSNILAFILYYYSLNIPS